MNMISSEDVGAPLYSTTRPRTEARAARTDKVPSRRRRLWQALYPAGSSSVSRIASTSGGTITPRTTFGQRSTGGPRTTTTGSTRNDHYRYARRPTMILGSKGLSPVPQAAAINKGPTQAYTGLHGATQDHMKYHMTYYII